MDERMRVNGDRNRSGGNRSWRSYFTRELRAGGGWSQLDDNDGVATSWFSVPDEARGGSASGARAKFVETNVQYVGERPSMLGFVYMFKDIIFRLDGSVLSFVVLETSISVILSFIALRYAPDEEFSPQGHTFVGTLLAFLTVFRSNTSYSLWEEGRICIGRVASASRVVANEILGAASDIAVASGSATLPAEAHEYVRLLKLLYFVIVEHVRSSDGHDAWNFSQAIAFSYASPSETAHLKAEFGVAQPGDSRNLVVPVSPPGVAMPWRAPSGMRSSTIRLENRFIRVAAEALNGDGLIEPTPQKPPPATAAVADAVAEEAAATPAVAVEVGAAAAAAPSEEAPVVASAEAAAVAFAEPVPPSPPGVAEPPPAAVGGAEPSFMMNPHDPTGSKPLVVVQWLRQYAMKIKTLSSQNSGCHFDHRRVANALDEHLEAFQGIHRVHSVYLPLPYCQLLKIIMICWIFSLPFVLTEECGAFLPFIMFLVSIAFFGIDQVGAELEGPYGIDANDLPLLHMGIALADDLDIVLRAAEASVKDVAAYQTRGLTSSLAAGASRGGGGRQIFRSVTRAAKATAKTATTEALV